MSDEEDVPLSKSDTAYFIPAVYDSRIVPDWNRGDVHRFLGGEHSREVPLCQALATSCSLASCRL